ncbi:response regulator [Halalkalibacter nanhaiisediminis]|uniref:Response regulator receiver domain-containing protein n=1 Tax=Halalkalibacter nanhaiisediminis TaxID=688079 RepID=A0A562QK40_9BACI|nr:response regulator [Halalkalibacter nanhaiisediminis]TWI57109.1 response regulator receiver domain-containing protein [Halalkalibacter nanhaiisediminis]
MNSLTVALIEDEPSHATLMDYHLKQIGVTVHLYTSGQAYLQEMDTFSNQLVIISDQIYAEQITDFVSELEKRSSVPMLIMTTGRQERVQTTTITIEYLHKPFSIHKFRQSVSAFLDDTLITI